MPRCKNCKQKFEPIRFLHKYCLKDECIKAFVEEVKTKQWKETKTRMKEDLKTTQDWLKEAQTIFNKYINLRDKGLPCCSCGKPIKGRVNASHFWNANNHHNVRFDEDNVHSSCITCNQFLSGNLLEYRTRLCSKIGQRRFDELEEKRHVTKKWTADELKEIIKKYKDLVRDMK
jgi:hypothetical protein